MFEKSYPQSTHLVENVSTIAPQDGHFFMSPNLSDLGATFMDAGGTCGF